MHLASWEQALLQSSNLLSCAQFWLFSIYRLKIVISLGQGPFFLVDQRNLSFRLGTMFTQSYFQTKKSVHPITLAFSIAFLSLSRAYSDLWFWTFYLWFQQEDSLVGGLWLPFHTGYLTTQTFLKDIHLLKHTCRFRITFSRGRSCLSCRDRFFSTSLSLGDKIPFKMSQKLLYGGWETNGVCHLHKQPLIHSWNLQESIKTSK